MNFIQKHLYGFVFKYIMIMLGCLCMAASINAFYLQHHFLSGGISGIALIVYYLFGLPVYITNIVLNIPLYFVAYRHFSRSFFVSTVFCSLFFSVALKATDFLIATSYVPDQLLSCLAAGIFNGVGAAMVYRVGASSGGTDIIGFMMTKYYNISVSVTNFVLGALLLVLGGILYGITPALYSLILFYITFKITNVFMVGFDYKKSLLIVTEEPDVIAASIMKEVERGVTYLYGEGAYTGKERKVLFVVVKLTQLAKIKRLIHEADPAAFVIVQDANDVLGRGFSNPAKTI